MRSFGWPLLAAVLLPPAAWGQPFVAMPGALQVRWRWSELAPPGWNKPGFNARSWQAPCFALPGWYPEEMEPEDQALHPFMWRDGTPGALNRPLYFRRGLNLPGRIEQAAVTVSADDYFDLYVNGLSIGRGREAHRGFTFDLTPYLRTGANVLGLRAVDLKGPGYGLLVVPEVTQSWPVDTGWQACRGPQWSSSPAAAKAVTAAYHGTKWPSVRSGWERPGHDTGLWPAAAPDGAPPIRLEGLPPFKCISICGGMPEFSEAYFRRAIYLDGYPLAGSLVILADDSYELYVNGTLASLEKRVSRAYVPRKVDITQLLHPGANVIAVKVTNDWGPGRLYCVPTIAVTF